MINRLSMCINVEKQLVDVYDQKSAIMMKIPYGLTYNHLKYTAFTKNESQFFFLSKWKKAEPVRCVTGNGE